MTAKEAEREWEKLSDIVEKLQERADEGDSRIDTLKTTIKEESEEISRLSASIRAKAKAIDKIKSAVATIDFEIKTKQRRIDYLVNNFDF